MSYLALSGAPGVSTLSTGAVTIFGVVVPGAMAKAWREEKFPINLPNMLFSWYVAKVINRSEYDKIRKGLKDYSPELAKKLLEGGYNDPDQKLKAGEAIREQTLAHKAARDISVCEYETVTTTVTPGVGFFQRCKVGQAAVPNPATGTGPIDARTGQPQSGCYVWTVADGTQGGTRSVLKAGVEGQQCKVPFTDPNTPFGHIGMVQQWRVRNGNWEKSRVYDEKKLTRQECIDRFAGHAESAKLTEDCLIGGKAIMLEQAYERCAETGLTPEQTITCYERARDASDAGGERYAVDVAQEAALNDRKNASSKSFLFMGLAVGAVGLFYFLRKRSAS